MIRRMTVFLSKISPNKDFNENRSYFCYFLSWISSIFLNFDGIHDFCARKLENLGWYSWNAKNQKNIDTHLVPRLEFNIFDFCISWNHPRFQVFLQKNREATKIYKKINETSTKKKSGFPLKPWSVCVWDVRPMNTVGEIRELSWMRCVSVTECPGILCIFFYF